MNVEQVELIRNSLIHVHPIADKIAESFYAHLFELNPHLRKLFTGDMNRQGTMLMTSLELAVSSLDDPAHPAFRPGTWGASRELWRQSRVLSTCKGSVFMVIGETFGRGIYAGAERCLGCGVRCFGCNNDQGN